MRKRDKKGKEKRRKKKGNGILEEGAQENDETGSKFCDCSNTESDASAKQLLFPLISHNVF